MESLLCPRPCPPRAGNAQGPRDQPVRRVGEGGWGCAAIRATQPEEASVATASNVHEKSGHSDTFRFRTMTIRQF